MCKKRNRARLGDRRRVAADGYVRVHEAGKRIISPIRPVGLCRRCSLSPWAQAVVSFRSRSAKALLFGQTSRRHRESLQTGHSPGAIGPFCQPVQDQGSSPLDGQRHGGCRSHTIQVISKVDPEQRRLRHRFMSCRVHFGLVSPVNGHEIRFVRSPLRVSSLRGQPRIYEI